MLYILNNKFNSEKKIAPPPYHYYRSLLRAPASAPACYTQHPQAHAPSATFPPFGPLFFENLTRLNTHITHTHHHALAVASTRRVCLSSSSHNLHFQSIFNSHSFLFCSLSLYSYSIVVATVLPPFKSHLSHRIATHPPSDRLCVSRISISSVPF